MIDEMQQNVNWLDREFALAVEIRNRRSELVSLLLDSLSPETQSELLPLQPVEPTQGTCGWFFKSTEFQSWAATGFDGVLLIEGLPGCGKTFLAEYLFQNPGTELQIRYSFYNSPKSVSFTASVLEKLLKMATSSYRSAKWHDRVIEASLPLAELILQRRREALRRLPEVLNDIFSRVELPETTIIVDALSNCADDMFGYLESISRSPKVRLVVLSRSDPRFSSAKTMKMDQSKIEDDVRAYAKARIAGSKGLSCVGNQILENVPRMCSGTFLPMKLVLDDLEQADSLEDQNEILAHAPTSLMAIYENHWSSEEPDDARSRDRRREIFSLLVRARKHLSVDDISTFIAVDVSTNEVQLARKLNDPLKAVEKLCRPFVSFTKRKVEITNPSIKDFVKQQVVKDPDAYLAEKCLSVLSQEAFASVPYAAALLRKHLLPQGLSTDNTVDKDSVPYEYAALHWWEHVTAVKEPSDFLLSKLYGFITGIPSVTWSERLADLKPGNEATTINVQIDVRAELSSWVRGLPPVSRPKIPLEDFFVAAHNKIRHELAHDEEDRLLPFLPAIRLGQWYNVGGQSVEDFQKAYDYKKIVVDGFTKVLGKRSPLTLKVRTEWVKDFFSQGRIQEAEMELSEIVQIEKEISGDASETFFKALQLLGTAQYCMTKFVEALASLRESGTGLLKLFGTNQWVCQVNDLYEGWVLERLGQPGEALKRYESIAEHWIPIAGSTNGLSLMAITSIGSVQRKFQSYEAAKSNLLESWTKRRRQFSLNNNTTVDSGLQLAVTYRESRAYNDALKILKQVGESSVFGTDFERICQAAHIRALVAFDQGEFHRPKNDLSRIIDETIGDKREKNNRECLWIRTTLADALKHHGERDEALMLFSELVKPLEVTLDGRPCTPTLKDEPEPPSQLSIAEKAVRLVKDRDQSGAAELLTKNGLQWVRQKDFWIQQGGPPTDTAWMKPVNFTELLSCSWVEL
ncbi:uncharacterized protein A1O5_11042 [Cladophialophora psammophila CBS 110553]|uniref:Nephrocystin 3-like N-terminal domain-containing protein n=1 Tax=Cladophialophora psammophila CBS 110553 TaxID=1182543 RepID=W9WMD4_9EURO|nr:uncharacterized protein A1O5_11042 [Cladophialophora psammophila CBS 110553]EXJ65801.1 hypothetical protein A1O5_11042 [Cladophialophora psammophila CBS 110553]